MGIRNDTLVDHEINKKTRRNQDEAQKRKLEKSLEQGLRGQLCGVRSSRCHPAGADRARQEEGIAAWLTSGRGSIRCAYVPL